MENIKDEVLDLYKYKIQSKLGSGSFGDVYKVQDINTNEIYAAKISKQRIRKLKNNPDGLLFLFREIKIMSSPNHPSIIRYIGYSPKNFDGLSKPTIITEYAPNNSLKDLINYEKASCSHKKWDITRKLICMYGIASGMSYLHHNNIIHRDLKAENILIDQYMNPKISDFGLSKVVNGITQSLRIQSQAGVKGTFLYMAPETFGGENYSESGDVFSFGMIVYEMMNIENTFEKFN